MRDFSRVDTFSNRHDNYHLYNTFLKECEKTAALFEGLLPSSSVARAEIESLDYANTML